MEGETHAHAKLSILDIVHKPLHSLERAKDISFLIDIETNLKIVNFLYITFNLNNGTFKLYKKPNDSLLYVCVCVCVCVYIYILKFKTPTRNNKTAA